MNPFNWKLFWSRVRPEKFDYIASASIAIVVMVLVVIAAVAESSGSQVIGQTLGASVNTSITNIFFYLDSFEMASSAVTFVFWAGVGLVLYMIVNSIYRISKEVNFEHDLSSDEYVRPVSKNRQDIVQDEILGAIVLLVCLGVLIIGLSLLVFSILPAAILNARAVALHPGVGNLVSVLAATTLLAVSIACVWLIVKAMMHRKALIGA